MSEGEAELINPLPWAVKNLALTRTLSRANVISTADLQNARH